MLKRWWRGLRARRELRRLLHRIDADERAARRAAALIAGLQSQIDAARRLSPGDEAAAVGVMKQLYAGVMGLRRKALADGPADEADVLAADAAILYLSVQIGCYNGQISSTAMQAAMQALAARLNTCN